MMKRRIFLSILAGTVVLLSQRSTQAHDDGSDAGPGRVFHRCVHAVQAAVERCEEANAKTAHRCIRRIKQLLEEGKREEAIATARRCIAQIERQSDNCVEHIRRTCRRCINRLQDLGAPELARRLARICEEAVEDVRRSQRRAIAAIKSQFDRNL